MPKSSRRRSIATLLEGRSAFIAGLSGSALLALVTVIDRVFTVPHLYRHLGDFVVHLAAELVANSLIWASAWLFWRAVRTLGRASGFAFRLGLAGTVVAVVGGVAAGVLACKIVFRHSILWPAFAAPVWWSSSAVVGAAVFLGLRRALASERPRRAMAVGAALTAVALAVHVWTMHRYLWQYGNLHFLAQVAVVVLVSVGLCVAFAGAGESKRLFALSGGVFAGCLVALSLAAPSQSARRSVAVWGAGARHLLLQVAWPYLDRDGDGAPARMWGVDPDDSDQRVTPFSVDERSRQTDDERLPVSFAPIRPRNLLWLIADTVRTDSLERLLRENAVIREAFAGFAFYPNYRTCSSRTYQVLTQLIGDLRCDPRERGETALLELLRARGYESELYTFYPPVVRFARSRRVADDAKLIELVRAAVASPSDAPKAVFVHLQSGHEPDDALGISPRPVYEERLRSSFEAIARLVRDVPGPDWTIVIVGDHGEAFGEHSSFGHATTLYDEVLRTGLLIRASRVSSGRREERLGCPDVAWKTLYALDILEREPRSLSHQYATLDLESSRNRRRDSIRALTVGSTKAVWRPWLGTWEFYDLERDPNELESLVESQDRRFAPLRARLERVSLDCERR